MYKREVLLKCRFRFSQSGMELSDGLLCTPKELPSGGSTTAVLRPLPKSQGLVDTLVAVIGFLREGV